MSPFTFPLYEKETSPRAWSPRVVPPGQPVPKGGGRYKIGDPYVIGGKLYVPREDPSYDRTGMASWYGEEFHGRRTANGEIYDMTALTAAHPTLPMPVYVKVTNLLSGRSLVVRVNDRGPFRNGRIIDLSQRAARLLGFARRGTAPVRVTYLGKAPLDGDDSFERSYLAQEDWWKGSQTQFTAAASRSRGQAEDGPLQRASFATAIVPVQEDWKRRVGQPVASAEGQAFYYVRAGAFARRTNAERVKARLMAGVPVEFQTSRGEGRILHVVNLGPFRSISSAQHALRLARQAGLEDALIIRR